MCLIFVSFKQHAKHPLVILANRDEFYNRPTQPAHFWEDNPSILAGKDLEGGGTWMGITRNGFLAMLTNYRDVAHIKSKAPTRGKLVSDYLQGEFAPKEYLMALSKTGHLYNGYNLIVGTVHDPWYYSNQQQKIVQLGTGLYGISNGLLHSKWPKVEQGKQELAPLLAHHMLDTEALFAVMANTDKAEDSQLPDTGLSTEKEKELSARFIATQGYGTRCTTLITLNQQGVVQFTERLFTDGRFTGNEHSFEFTLK